MPVSKNRRKNSKNLPPHYSIGSKEEAIIYVDQNRENWSATKGALQWLAENM